MTYQEEFNNSKDPERILYILRHHSDEIDPSDMSNIAIKKASDNGGKKLLKIILGILLMLGTIVGLKGLLYILILKLSTI